MVVSDEAMNMIIDSFEDENAPNAAVTYDVVRALENDVHGWLGELYDMLFQSKEPNWRMRCVPYHKRVDAFMRAVAVCILQKQREGEVDGIDTVTFRKGSAVEPMLSVMWKNAGDAYDGKFGEIGRDIMHAMWTYVERLYDENDGKEITKTSRYKFVLSVFKHFHDYYDYLIERNKNHETRNADSGTETKTKEGSCHD